MNRAQVLENEFARDVRAGLTRPGQKTLPCRYFYDAVGSALFEAITLLPEYGLTRADARLIDAHAGDIAECVGGAPAVVELGSGSGSKTRRVLQATGRVTYYPIDVSRAALAHCAQSLADLADVQPIEGSYLEGLREAASRRLHRSPMLVLFLGSTIGNFEPDGAAEFLYALRCELQPGDTLLLGTDLVKPVAQLLDAYDDAAGVTAAFNLNLLCRINRELGGDFQLRQFEHMVRYDGDAQRIEMHLRSLSGQCVTVPEARLKVRIETGETIHTESSHKFHPAQVEDMAKAGGFRMEAQWLDGDWGFAETLLRAV